MLVVTVSFNKQPYLTVNHCYVFYTCCKITGPQGAYELDKYSYLRDEIHYIQQCHNAETPILGLCLGCQLTAVALGGKAYKADKYEVGYIAQHATAIGQLDPVISPLFNNDKHNNDTLLMHHQDTYTLPSHVTSLCISTLNGYNAAFKYNNTYGVQSHPESGINELLLWKEFAYKNYASIGLTSDDIINQAKQKQTEAYKSTELFFDLWWKFVLDVHKHKQ